MSFTRPLLFTQYPTLERRVAYWPVADLPTPVQALPELGEHAWVKRDDLSHPHYGGNKIRKLAFILAEAQRRGKDHVVTFGAIGTNHGVATALLCREAGLRCSVLLFDQPVTDTVRQNLRLMQACGAELIHAGSLANCVRRYYLNRYRLRPRSYFLFAGGSNTLGTLAFVDALFELKQQVAEGLCPQPHTIICPTGSASTVAGLTLGCALAQWPVRVVGIRVTASHLGPIPICTPATVRLLMSRCYRELRALAPDARLASLPHPLLWDKYYGEGYGRATAAGERALALARQRAGLKLEPTYTAKAFAAFLDCLDNNSQPCLYWHTYNSREMGALATQADTSQLPASLRGL